MNTKKTFALLIAAAAALAGCASAFNPAGDSSYDCNRKENPDSPYCHSFRAVVEATNGPLPGSRYDEQMDISEIDRLQGIAPVPRDGNRDDKGAAPSSDRAGELPLPHQVQAGELPDGAPVRIAPVIQRTWIAPYRDRNDVLHGEEYLHKEIVPSRWAGHPPATSTSQLRGAAAKYPHRAPVATPPADQATTQQSATRPSTASANFTQPGATKPQDQPSTDLNETGASMPN